MNLFVTLATIAFVAAIGIALFAVVDVFLRWNRRRYDEERRQQILSPSRSERPKTSTEEVRNRRR